MAFEHSDEELDGISEAELEEARRLAESLDNPSERAGAELRLARVLENHAKTSLDEDIMAKGRERLFADLGARSSPAISAERRVVSLFARRVPLVLGSLAAAAALAFGFGVGQTKRAAEETASYVLPKTHGDAAKRLAGAQSRYLAEAMKPGERGASDDGSLDDSLREYRIELMASYEAGR